MGGLISVLMPVFLVIKHKKLFTEAISGILNQTYSNWELLIASDGDDKDNIKCIRDVVFDLGNDNRIKIFNTEKNYGPGVIRNILFNISNGKYITTHDSDDFSEPTRFEELMNIMDENGIVASNVKMITKFDNGAENIRIKGYTGGDKLDLLISQKKVRPPIHLPSAIISSKLFKEMGGFEMQRYSSDSCMAIKIGYLREMTFVKSIPVIDRPLFVWNRHSHSITTLFKNKLIVKRCQSVQRKPLIRGFRKQIIDGKVLRGGRPEHIKTILGINNNLNNLPNLIEITKREK